ncbi:hypothetical protein PCANB_001037 [Pneumocystis canis]|nr:hypothetical protein PCANB_001037 [Pneumocystis canis]
MTQSQAVVPFTTCDDWNVVFRDATSEAVVLFNRENKQLSLYRNVKNTVLVQNSDTTFCPLCYRPFHTNNHTNPDESSLKLKPFVDSEYFRFLEDFYWDDIERSVNTAQSLSNTVSPDLSPLGSTPLSSTSFNQGYFERFFISQGSLGRGSRGEVLKVLHVLDGVPLGYYAVKRIPVGDNHSWLKKLLKEVHLLRLRHTNLVNYNHVCKLIHTPFDQQLELRDIIKGLENSELTKFGPVVPVLYILQEYCDKGDLESFIRDLIIPNEPTLFDLKKRAKRLKGKPFFTKNTCEIMLPLEMITSFLKDIASGLNFLHENNLIHRDLKPGNCLLQSTKNGFYPRALVSDFGESQVATEVNSRSGGTGTLEYTAPEVLFLGEDGKPKGFFTPASDVFSLGLILYWLLFAGKLPYKYSPEEYDKLRCEILNFKGYRHDYKKSSIPDDLYRFLETMLSPTPHERPSSLEVVEFITKISKEYNFRNAPEKDQSLQFDEFERLSRIIPVPSQENLTLSKTKCTFACYDKKVTTKNKPMRFGSLYRIILRLLHNIKWLQTSTLLSNKNKSQSYALDFS